MLVSPPSVWNRPFPVQHTNKPQIVQDSFACRTPFLARPEWRRLSKSPDESTSTTSAVSLRTSLCECYLEMTDLLDISTNLLSSEKRFIQDPDFRTICRATLSQLRTTSEQFRAWYAQEAQGYNSREVNDSRLNGENPAPAKRSVEGPQGTLFLILECVANTIFYTLKRVIFYLDAVSTSDCLDEATRHAALEEMKGQEKIAQELFRQVSARSPIAAKPLLFGLQQIRARERAGDEYLSAIHGH